MKTVTAPPALVPLSQFDWESIAEGVWKLRCGTPEEITPIAVRRSSPAWDRLSALPEAPTEPPLAAGAIRCRTSPRGILIQLPFSPDEGIFGLGLQLKSHLQSGKKKHLRVNSDPLGDTGDSHAPAPFYASTHGYAVLVDTARYASFYVGTHEEQTAIRKRAVQKEATPTLDTEQLYRCHAFGSHVAVDIPTAKGVDIYLFAGPGLREAVSRYVLFSGGGCLPPLWGLGNWYRTCSKHTEAEARGLIESFERDRLPFHVLGLEPGWHTQSYPSTFTWSERFPNPKVFSEWLASKGYRMNLWEHAFLHPDATFAAEIAPYCADLLAMDGLAPDFLHTAAVGIFAQQHSRLLDDGAASFKLDECDNSDFISYSWSFPEHTAFPSGADGEQMHCLYGIHYQHAVNDAYCGRGQRHFGLARSSGPLAASLPYALYSDLYDHADYLRGLVNAGFSGFLWCPEVRHATSVEDLIRRLQTAALSPLCQVNGWYIPQPPWKQVDRHLNIEGAVMAEADEATALVREILELRMRILPVLYTAFARYRETGVPPFRAMVMDYPRDKAAWNCDQQFLIGDSLLAAPLKTGEQEKSVYLPEGIWHDFQTGAVHHGGTSLTLQQAPLNRIPLFVRDGSILPLADPTASPLPGEPLLIHPHIYADKTAVGELYEDDGVSTDYEGGRFRWHRLTWNRRDGLTTQIRVPGYDGPSLYRWGTPVVIPPLTSP